MPLKLASLVVLCGVAQADPSPPTEIDDLATPAPERGAAAEKLLLPVVPDFTLPAPPVGMHDVQELRVRRDKLLDTEIALRGTVTWVYDCAIANRRAGETDRDLHKRIEDDPTLCERPKFYLGDDANTPVEKSLWVVDVPRVYNKLEMTMIAKADRTAPDRCEPGAKASICPVYRVGDRVIITGKFTRTSPHSERNSDGLLVYGKMMNYTQHWSAWPGAAPDVAQARSPRAPLKTISPQVPPPRPPGPPVTRMRVDPNAYRISKDHLNKGNRAMGGKQLADAEVAYHEALDAWAGNHLAWFGLGGALAQEGKWKDAVLAFEHTADLRPDVAMYQMWLGVALYEAAIAQAREDEARREHRKPEEVELDLSAINFDKSLAHLQKAVAMDAGLWRAAYYAGRIYRAREKSREAAELFSRAIAAQPRQSGPFIALAELYRKWDYTDEAILVAQQGTQTVLAGGDVSDLWFVLGMAYDDKRHDREAVEAFSKAIEVRRDNLAAKFQRGQTYFRMRDYANAKRDLTDFVKAAGPSFEFQKQECARMLMEIAAAAAAH